MKKASHCNLLYTATEPQLSTKIDKVNENIFAIFRGSKAQVVVLKWISRCKAKYYATLDGAVNESFRT